jgi:hypothetical protein
MEVDLFLIVSTVGSLCQSGQVPANLHRRMGRA